MVLVRQRPGNGKAIFITLEDETGITNIVLWERTLERFRSAVMGARLLVAEGRVQKSPESVVHLMAHRLLDRTGDLARMDADGFLHLAGRLSRFSKIGGEMVPHGTVEEALLKVLDLVGSAELKLAVSSAADPAKGEQLVVLHVDDLDVEATRTALAAAGLANLWIPKVFKKVPGIPILGTGKLDLNRLRQMAQG